LQNWPSSQTIGVPAHTSSLQTSPVVQGFRSSHGAVLFGCVQAPSPSHWSSVQTSPSSVHSVSAAVWQSCAASLQVLSHSAPPVHGSPLCVQAPPLQVSVPLQKRPSLHGAVFFGCVHAPAPLHTSSVQTLPSLVQAVPAPAWQSWAASLHELLHSAPPVHGSPLCVQVPPLQVSVPLQKSPSSQEAVFGVCAQVPAPLQASSVQTLPSLVQAVPAGV